MSGAAGQRLSLYTIVNFSLSTIPVSALGVVLVVYIPPYLAGHMGVSLAAIGAVWMAVRLIDLFIDPLLGHAMDRTETRFGRYRVWLAGGVPIFMLGTYMLFMAPKGIGELYIFVWLFLLYIGNSILSLAQQAWSATLATGYNERSRVFGVGVAVGVFATVAPLFIPIFQGPLGLSEAGAIQAMGLAVVIMTPLSVGLACWLTPERVNRSSVHHFVAKDYLEIVTNPGVVRLFLAQVALTLGPGWMAAMYIFYFKDVLGYSQQASTILLVFYILIGVAGAPVTAWVAQRFGKHRTLMATTTAFSLGLLTVMFVPKGNVLAGLPTMGWCGFMAAGFGLMINAMMADVGDEIRLNQGKERISLLYSVLTFAAKLTAGFGIGLSSLLLARFGYLPAEGAHNTQEAIAALQWIFILAPIFFVMLGGFCVLGWTLDAARHAEIRAELDARDAAELGSLAIALVPGGPPTIIVAAGDVESPSVS
ncbi:MAG TPA: MFS transporter [Rhizomicrobium sp.]